MTEKPVLPMPSASVDALLDAAADHATHPEHWAFTIVHGDIETGAEQQILETLSQLAHRTGHLLTVYGTNDTTAYVFDAAGGRTAVLAMQGEAITQGRFWWRTYTRFGGDA